MKKHVTEVAKLESAAMKGLSADEMFAFVTGRMANMISMHTRFLLQIGWKTRQPTPEEQIGVCMGVIQLATENPGALDQDRVSIVHRQILALADVVKVDP